MSTKHDIRMDELLQQWGLEKLVPIFQENDITIENMIHLTDNHLKKLKVSLGHRIILQDKVKLYMEQQSNIENEQDILNLDVVFKNVEQDSTETETVTTADTNTEDSNIHVEKIYTVLNRELIPSENISISRNNSNESNMECTLPDIVEFPEFDLKTLLTMSPHGNSILKYYKNNETLSSSLRTKLVDIVGRHLFNYMLKNRLTHSQYDLITSKIITLFPNECSSTYYIPAICKNESPTGRAVLARGKLIDKCRNMLYHSGDKCFMKIRKRGNETSSEDKPREKVLITEDVLWLKHNTEPWSEVLKKWTTTFPQRKVCRASNFHDFLKEWPPLNDIHRAEQLINVDFNLLFPNRNVKLFDGWDLFMNTVLRLRKTRDTHIEYLIDKRNDTTISEDSRFIFDLHLLAHTVPPKGRIVIRTTSGSKHWKFSITECLKGIPESTANSDGIAPSFRGKNIGNVATLPVSR